jgi:hypothetical protein
MPLRSWLLIGVAAVLILAYPRLMIWAQQAIPLECRELTESSGIATSLNDNELVWSHNDSGGRPRLYLFEAKSGKLRSVFEVQNTLNNDWEDICSFRLNGKNYLAIGDIGDNARRRDHIEICIIEEPPPPSDDRTATLENPKLLSPLVTLKVTYPDGAYDCEALAFDAAQKRFILITKDYLMARVMSVPLDLALLDKPGSQASVKAQQLQTITITLVTGADICEENRQLVICNYGAAYTFDIQADKTSLWNVKSMKRVNSPKRQQGEAIAYSGAKELLFTSEGSPTPFWRIELKSETASK